LREGRGVFPRDDCSKVLRDTIATNEGIGLRSDAGAGTIGVRRPGDNRAEDPVKLREITVALSLEEWSEDWDGLFDAAARRDALPADIRHMAGRKMIPVLLRTIDNRQLDDASIGALIAEIEARLGEPGDGA